MARPRLLLFDIDGTLLSCGGVPGHLFAHALEVVFGTAGGIGGYDFAGKTDPQIVVDLMTAAGLPRHEVIAQLPAVRQCYVEHLEAGLEAAAMRLMPGVEGLLAGLSSQGDFALGLLTGNWEAGARIKLSRVGLSEHFAFGGFGDDGIERSDLVPAALARASAARGESFAADEALIIGDTVLDVACGRAHGVPVLGVATGRTSAAALAAAGADWVVQDLESAGWLPWHLP